MMNIRIHKTGAILSTLAIILVILFSASVRPAGAATVEQAYPGLASHILRSAELSAMDKGVILKSEGIEIKESLLSKQVEKAGPAIQPQLRKNLFFLLEQETMKRVLVREARRAGISLKNASEEDQVIQAYLGQVAREVKVSEEEMKAFYEETKEMVGGASYDQVREAIREILLQKKRMNVMDTHVRELMEKADIQLNEKWVKAQYAVAMDNPVDKARSSGTPTMVEFGSENCMPCRMMQPILEKLRKDFAGEVNIVFANVEEDPILGARFGIRSIPVQIFYDKNGREVSRHIGFYPEREVLKELENIGVRK